MVNKKTVDDFRNWLREQARKMSSGELSEFFINDMTFAMIDEKDFHKKATSSYMRMIIEREMEKVSGEKPSLSIKRHSDDEGRTGYIVSINKGKKREKRKNIGRKEAERRVLGAAHESRLAVARAVLGLYPNLSDMKGKELEAANEAMRRFHEAVRAMFPEVSE